ncbi:hypothetical protein D3C86_1354180 [compost metagenome]
MSGYFISQLYNPLIFAAHGPIAAGQFGMSFAIANAVSVVAMAWMNTKLPRMGELIALRDYKTLDGIFFPTLWRSLGVILILALIVGCGYHVFSLYDPSVTNRLISFEAFIVLLATVIINHIVYCEALYLRAHLKEPFMVLSIINATVSTFIVTYSVKFGILSVVLGYFLVNLLIGLGLGTRVFIKKRHEWHQGSWPTKLAEEIL